MKRFSRIFSSFLISFLLIQLIAGIFLLVPKPREVKANSQYSASFSASSNQWLRITDSGSNDSLSVGNSDFTFAGWVYFNTLVGAGVISKWDYPTGDREYVIYKDGTNKLGFLASNNCSSITTNLTTTTNTVASKWYFVVAWHDSVYATTSFQIDNGYILSQAHSGGICNGSAPFKLGSWGSANYLNGMIDNVGVWRRVLTASERSQLYSSGNSLSYLELSDALKLGLTSWWDLDETSGNRNDSHGTNNLTDESNNVTRAAGVNGMLPINLSNPLNHILSTGQSLSLGQGGSPALTTIQPYSNVMLSGSSLIPLVESSVETISSAMANLITSEVAGNDYQVAVTRHGQSSAAYSVLKKGTAPYSNGIAQVNSVKTAADNQGVTYKVIGVTAIHGESDHVGGTTQAQYEADLAEWQNDYETDVKAITGQSGTIPLFTDQISSWTGYNSATSVIPYSQLGASEDYQGKVILIGPKYFLDYADNGGHLTNTSYRWLGEYYGKVIHKVVVNSETWRPLSPREIVRSGNAIYIRFYVPSPPIVFDTINVLEQTNKGFEYTDDSGSPPTITNVEIFDAETVKVTLSATPTGANQKMRYAYTGVSGSRAGRNQSGSARGNLRDSDNTASIYGNNLYNWAVHFDKAVTVNSITAPTIITPTILSSSAISWNFTDNASNETGFRVYTNADAIATSSATANLSSLTETGLSENTQYTRYVKAYNSYGESASSSATSTYTLADTPTGFGFLRHPSSLDIYVDGFPNSSSGSSGYLFWRTDNSAYNSGWIQDNNWQDPNMVEGQTYTYAVKYRNGDGVETATTTLGGVSFVRSSGGGGIPTVQEPTIAATSSQQTTTTSVTSTQISTSTSSIQATTTSQQTSTSTTPNLAGLTGQARQIAIQQIKAQILEIQKKLIILISQLIQLLQTQLNQL